MHLADSLTRRRRYAARLIAGNHKQTRFFCFARGSVAAKPIFGGASDRFAANLLACGFQSTFILGGASGSFSGKRAERGTAAQAARARVR